MPESWALLWTVEIKHNTLGWGSQWLSKCKLSLPSALPASNWSLCQHAVSTSVLFSNTLMICSCSWLWCTLWILTRLATSTFLFYSQLFHHESSDLKHICSIYSYPFLEIQFSRFFFSSLPVLEAQRFRTRVRSLSIFTGGLEKAAWAAMGLRTLSRFPWQWVEKEWARQEVTPHFCLPFTRFLFPLSCLVLTDFIFFLMASQFDQSMTARNELVIRTSVLWRCLMHCHSPTHSFPQHTITQIWTQSKSW